MKRVRVAGLKVDDVPRADAVEVLFSLLSTGTAHLVTYVNPHACNLATRHPEFAQVINESRISFCDGTGVYLASKWLGNPVRGRFTYPQIADDFFARCANEKQKFFVVGESKEDIQRFTETLKSHHPTLVVSGVHHGFFDLNSNEDICLKRDIYKSGPEFILVGMGMPKQEIWGESLVAELDRGIVVCVGALFKYYAGIDYRGPAWMTENGLEWLWRLISHPIRYFKRYAIGNLLFLWRVYRKRSDLMTEI